MILSSFKAMSGTVRLFIIAGMLTAILGAIWTVYNTVWTAGYNKAQLEFQNESIEIANAAVAKARIQWDASAAAAETQIIIEEKIVEKIRVVEKQIPVVVESVAAECRDLGPDVARLFNEAISAANSPRKGTPATP